MRNQAALKALELTCEVCRHTMTAVNSPSTFLCTRCGLWRSALAPVINRQGHALSESHRFRGLEHVRRVNIDHVLDRLARLGPLDSRRVLDVGCAYGWFLEAAAARGMIATGIEPDSATAQMARDRNLNVIEGYFPECLPSSARFDIIVFNDVLEHIPGVHGVLAACARRLCDGGVLALSVPVSSGTLFRMAALAARAGWTDPWNRLWQTGFPSPHIYYFDRRTLDAATRQHGFHRVDALGTLVFHPRGLWARLNFDRRSSLLFNAVTWSALVAAYPAYRLLGRPDTELLIYRHGAGSAAGKTRRS